MAVFKKQGVFWIDYYVNGRRKRERIGPDKRLAETVLKKRQVAIAEGKYLDKTEGLGQIMCSRGERGAAWQTFGDGFIERSERQGLRASAGMTSVIPLRATWSWLGPISPASKS